MLSPEQDIWTIPSQAQETLWKKGQEESMSQTVRRAVYCHLLGKTQQLPTWTQQLRMPCLESAQECVHQEWMEEKFKASYHSPMNYFLLMNSGSREIIVSRVTSCWVIGYKSPMGTPKHHRLLVTLRNLLVRIALTISQRSQNGV